MAVKGQKMRDAWERVKAWFLKLSKKMRILLVAGSVGILLFAVIMTVFLNTRATAYQVLYPGMQTEGSSQVYQALLGMGALPKLNEINEVMVPSQEADIWLLALAAEGYPQSVPGYDLYANNAGMMATETDRKKWDIYQTQDRIQEMLSRMNGVVSAVVNITVPENSDYIWQMAENTERPTGSVLLTLKTGVTFLPQQVTAVKTIVASSVQNMRPEDVTVVDAKTSLEMSAESSGEEAGLSSSETLELEKMVQKQIEDNVVKLLTSRYGSNGVVASAKVTLNFDKMLQEKKDLIEKPKDENGEGGGGYPTHNEGVYGTTDGNASIGGIVGEEDNTDIPQMGYITGTNGDDDMVYNSWSTDLDYSYVKTQIEKGNAPIERATVSVMVDETSMTENRRAELTSLVSTATDIVPELIFVSSFNPDAAIDVPSEEPAPVEQGGIFDIVPLWAFIVAGVVLILLVVVLILLIRRNKRKKKLLAAQRQAEEEAAMLSAQEEIENYKKQLTAAAKSSNNAKEDAILNEVRDFAKENPEITAGLLRSWLRESE